MGACHASGDDAFVSDSLIKPSDELLSPATEDGGPPLPRLAGEPELVVWPAFDSETLEVTRLAEMTSVSSPPRFLIAGTDTLDVGIFVEFDSRWSRIVSKLSLLRRQARKTKGKQIGGGRCVMHPGSPRANYPFHIQYPGFQLFLSRKREPDGETPNAFVCLGSNLLWEVGERAALAHALGELVELVGGTVRSCLVSRCDLTADFLVPGGLTDSLLRAHGVTRSQKAKVFLDQGNLETFYAGTDKAPIQLRLYDKSEEIKHSGKDWFLPLWGLAANQDVWRVEYQCRRDFLRSAEINSLDEYLAKRADLWHYLTTSWFSLRLPLRFRRPAAEFSG